MRHSILTLSLLLSGLQTLADGQPPHSQSPISILGTAADTTSQLQLSDESIRWATNAEERDFTTRLNKLTTALHDFSVTYNSGHVVDVRKVRAVRKAWLDLEKSGWFRAEK
jgi:hypothetical protein